MAPGSALAADADMGAEAPGGAIVVTGHGLADTPAVPAYDVQTLGREALLNAPSGRIEDVLGNVAGFQEYRRSDSRAANPSAQGVTLRALGGNAASRTLVLLDGVPMADPFFGSVALSALAPERLSSARVTRGGGSGAFGAGAVSGTIELNSANAQEMGLLNAEAAVDNRAESAVSATLSPQLGNGFVQVSGRWDRGEGFWTTPVAQRVPASVRAAYEGWSGQVRLVQQVGASSELQARLMSFGDNRTLRFAGANSMDRGSDASIRLVGHGRWAYDVLAYGQLRDFANVVISSTTYKPTLNQFKTPTTGYGGKAELRPPVGHGQVLRLGADVRVAQGNEQERALNASTGALTATRKEGGRNSDVGLYLEDDWTLGRLVLTGGARADRWDIDNGAFTQLSPAGVVTTTTTYPDRGGWAGSFRGGARFQLTPDVAVRAAGYSSLRSPTLNELYRSYNIGSVTNKANAALTNERLVGYEAGVEMALGKVGRLEVTAFDNQLRHAIANVTIAANTQQRQNVDAIRARGVEATLGLKAGAFSLDGSLAYTEARVESHGSQKALNGLAPPQTPSIAISTTLGWRPRAGWLAQLGLRHVGDQYEDDLHTGLLPRATTINALVQAPLGHGFSFSVRGENLADVSVITRNQAGSLDVGAPRTIWFGLRYGGHGG
ncbi:MAG TPA: TonB-dependent receptor [Novosphingobium sp.]|nr:TonB-dependent receptor [Novosphingobium sp.]HZV09675.1 TonB-dependent receptor [Novosphingobium sp.]